MRPTIRFPRLAVAFTLILAANSPLAAGPIGYSIFEIPYVPYAISASGQTAACSGAPCYFLNGIGGQWSAIPDTEGGISSINDSGELTSRSSSLSHGTASLWTNPANSPVAITNTTGSAYLYDAYINDAGHLLLFGNNGSFYFSAANGAPATVVNPSEDFGNLSNLNDSDMIAGGTARGGLGIWNPTTGLEQLETSVTPATTGTFINNSDEVAFRDNSGPEENGLLYFWNGTSLQSIGLPAGCASAAVNGLTDSGEVVASCPNGPSFVWEDGVTTSLDSLLPAGWTTPNDAIYTVSSSGIIGTYVENGANGSYALLVPDDFSPVPEPSSLSLAISAVALLGIRGFRRHPATRRGKQMVRRILCAMLAVLPLHAGTITYTWTEIDTSGLSDQSALYFSGGISLGGTQVVGDLRASGGDLAFLASGSSVQSLGSLGGTYSTPFGINGSGEVVGYSTTAGGASQAFTWTSASGMQELIPSSSMSAAYAINSSGDITGYGYFNSGLSGAFFYSPSGGLDVFGANVGRGYAINDSGEVAGGTNYGQSDAFVWSADSGLTDLGTEFGWGESAAYAINDLGQTAGVYYTTPGYTYTGEAFLYTPGSGYQTLTNGIAHGMNDSGVVVGEYFPPGIATGSANPEAFVYTPGSGVSLLNSDLGTPLPRSRTLYSAIAVNNAGDILAIDSNGDYVQLDPAGTPEPGTWGLTLAAIITGWALRRPRKRHRCRPTA